jgi:glutathione S-transferase
LSITLNKDEKREAAFLETNLDGKVPVLIDDELTLAESNEILHYLRAKFQSHLWPAYLNG